MLTLKNHIRQDAIHNAYQRILEAIQPDSAEQKQEGSMSLTSSDGRTELVYYTGYSRFADRMFLFCFNNACGEKSFSVEIMQGSELYHSLLTPLKIDGLTAL